jgi:hypothetical protein
VVPVVQLRAPVQTEILGLVVAQVVQMLLGGLEEILIAQAEPVEPSRVGTTQDHREHKVVAVAVVLHTLTLVTTTVKQVVTAETVL